ncbi:hypothetical protein PIB30_110558, partial [Stylosanthes scabra]|nr:hypothetical protein [Stylosanthes scabra]
VAFVANPDIWRAEHMGLWTAVCPLIYFGSIKWHQVDRVIPQFGGVQNYPHRPLNIDFLHAKDGRGGDRWFPTTYQLWHGLWASRHDQTFVVEEAQDPGPSAEYLRWWYLAGKRYLAPAGAFHPRPPDEIPAEAFQRVAETPQATQVDDAPDNRRQDRRRMVVTRTTARDWQWLDQMMGEDDEVAAPRRVRRMPEGGGRRGSRGGGRSRGRASVGQGQHGDTVYRPEFDGSSRMSQMDLNEPPSAPSQIFKAHAGTPPSAHVPDPYVLVSDPAPAPPPQDHALPITDADDGGAPRGRARWVPRRRGCGTGGHM